MVSYIKGGMQAKGIWKQILRRIFGPKRDENGEWRRLHNEELHSLYRSPNIVRVIKSRRLTWVGHVARMEIVFSYEESYFLLTFPQLLLVNFQDCCFARCWASSPVIGPECCLRYSRLGKLGEGEVWWGFYWAMLYNKWWLQVIRSFKVSSFYGLWCS